MMRVSTMLCVVALCAVGFVSASVAPATATESTPAPCAQWIETQTELGRREGAVVVSTPTHVVVWGGDDGSGNGIQLSGASLRLSTNEWTAMADPPTSSPQGVAVTTSGQVLFSAKNVSLFDPERNRWTDGWRPPISKNAPLLVETPRHIVAIQRDILGRGTNGVEIVDRSGTGPGDVLPSPPSTIDYESSAVWVRGGARGLNGRVIVIQASGENFSLDLTTRKWSTLPPAPVEVINRNFVSGSPSRVTVLGFTTSKEGQDRVAFAFLDPRTNTWSLGPKTRIPPEQVLPAWGAGSNRPTQLLSGDNGRRELLVVWTNGDQTTVDRYTDRGVRRTSLPPLAARPTAKFVNLPNGRIGVLLQNGAWATTC
jgi:hypothetical protein